MLFGQATTIPAVLQAIAARLVEIMDLDGSQTFLSLADDDTLSRFPSKDVFVQIAPLFGNPRPGDVIGGGTQLFTVDLRVAVNLWVRLNLDVAFQDNDQLSHATLGQLTVWRELMRALEMFYPDPGVGQEGSIFAEPMRNVGFSFQPRQPKHQGWAKLPTAWTVPAVLDLTKSS